MLMVIVIIIIILYIVAMCVVSRVLHEIRNWFLVKKHPESCKSRYYNLLIDYEKKYDSLDYIDWKCKLMQEDVCLDVGFIRFLKDQKIIYENDGNMMSSLFIGFVTPLIISMANKTVGMLLFVIIPILIACESVNYRKKRVVLDALLEIVDAE